MIIINATFTGNDSLGYEHGKEYMLHIRHLSPLLDGSAIQIWRVEDNRGQCPYRNIETFLANWDKISVYDVELGRAKWKGGER